MIVIMRSQDIIATGLRNMGDEYCAAARELEKCRAARDEAVRDALAAGWTQRAVAAAAGVTPGRVGQIATAGRITKS